MSDIRIASISDIHIGHARVSAAVIHANLEKILYPYLNDELDLLIIAGDFFDTLLDMNGQNGFHAAHIIDELRYLAEQHNFFIRIVRGTFSHDRLQNQFFTKEVSPVHVRNELMVRLFETITIEHIEALGIYVLYVPDDLPYEDAMPVIRERLSACQLDRVDIAVVHSYFTHLLPKNMPRVPTNTYDADIFGRLVKGVVFNGHVHRSNVYKKVITNGSFERLAHGEEEPKGFFMVSYNTSSAAVSHEFIVNKYATRFNTFDLDKCEDREHALEYYINWLHDLRTSNISTAQTLYVRVTSSDVLLKAAVVEYTRTNFADVQITLGRATGRAIEQSEEIITEITSLPIITEVNLASMIVQFLKDEKDTHLTVDVVNEVLHAPN